MDETLRNWLLGIGATAVGVVLGSVNQWWFTKRAERREIKRILINLKGETEGKGMLIYIAAKELTTAHWNLTHRRWQDKNQLADLPKGCTIRNEKTELILVQEQQIEYDKFRNIVAELRVLITQFKDITENKDVFERYMAIQDYDPLVYKKIEDMSEAEYRNNLYIRLPEVMNKVNNELGKIFDALYGIMETLINSYK